MLTFDDIAGNNCENLVEILDAPNIKFKHIKIDKNSCNGKKKEDEEKYYETLISSKLKGGNMDDKIKEDHNNKKKLFNQMVLKEGKFQYVPDKNRERDVVLYLGMAGSGKSFQINEYLKRFVIEFKGWQIYMFSEKHEDVSITVPVKRIRLDQSLRDLKWEDFEESCCIFDDVDGLDKGLKDVVYGLRDKMLKLGRQKRINVLMSNHNSTDGKETKTAINEARVIVVFLANYNRSMKYLLEQYLGLEKDQISRLKKNKSRATYFLKTYPNIVIQDDVISTIADF